MLIGVAFLNMLSKAKESTSCAIANVDDFLLENLLLH